MIAIDTLSIGAIRARLTAATVGSHLYLFDEVTSTNKVLRQLARSGAAEGTVVLAERQTDGRGRLGQEWFSPGGVNLYASALFRNRLAPGETPLFFFIASLAVADAVRELGLHPAIKWPNDVLVGRKKVAGALMECATRGNTVDVLVAGVGVNLNVDLASLRSALGPAGVGATSLAAVLGHDIDRNAFAASYLNHLDAWALRFRAEGPAPVLAAWRQRDILTGRRVEARGEREIWGGRVLGVNDAGQLMVQPSSGDPRRILNEEIRVLD
jgi:BirA family transcriptional regulator, biotin operon repressor / biotin---[acetyl-CoA-carboxylase] ligase